MYEARLAAIAMAAQRGEVEYRIHALDQMRREDRSISRAALEYALGYGDIEVVEDYAQYDAETRTEYPPCMLVMGWIDGRPFHVVVTYHRACAS